MLKNIIKNKFIKKIIAMSLVIMLTITNFIFIAVESYAIPATEDCYMVTEDGTVIKVPATEIPRTEIGIWSNKTTLSAVQEVNEVSLAISLITNNSYNYLYKNPTFEIEIPEYTTIAKLNNVQMSASTELEISNYYIEDNKIIIQVTGEQTKHNDQESSLNAQITVDMELTVEDTIPSTTSYFTIKYKNENEKNEDGTIVERTEKSDMINIYTGYGIVTKLKIENYEGNNGVIETSNTTEQTKQVQINMNEESKKVKVTATVINNYQQDISNLKVAFYEMIKKYDGTEKEIHINRVETYEYNEADGSQYLTYDVDNEMEIGKLEAQKSVEVTTTITIPENLYYNEEIDINYIASYDYNGTTYKPKTAIKLGTETKDIVGDVFISDDRTIRLEVAKVLGNGTLVKNEESIKEGTAVKYLVTVTNLSSEDIEKMSMTVTRENNNSKFYEYKYYGQGIFNETLYTKEEIEDVSKQIEIAGIKAKEDTEVQFELVVSENAENKNLVNKIELTSNDYKVIFNGQNFMQTEATTIEDAEIKVNLKYAVPQTQNVTAPNLRAGMSDTLILDITNITESELKNIQIKLDASKYSFIKDISIEDTSAKNYSFKDGIFTYTIEKLNAGERYTENIKIDIDKIETASENIKLNIEAKANNTTYTSNQLELNIIDNEIRSEVTIESNIENEATIKNETEIEYILTIKNTGNNQLSATIYDKVPSTFIINDFIVNEESKKDAIETDTNIINHTINLNAGEQAIVKIKIKVNSDILDLDNEIRVNIADKGNIFTYKYTVEESSNTEEVTNPIEPEGQIDDVDPNAPELVTEPKEDEDETENPSNPSEEGSGESSGNNSGETENPDETEERKYTIEGKIWLDTNKNGAQDSDEKAISGIKVMLIDSKNQNTFVKDEDGNILEYTTGANGTYKFTEIPKGEYIVIFDYDTDNYEITEYKKEEVAENLNSDVKTYTKTDGTLYAVTDNIELKSNLKNIDMGLTELPEFDLKIDSYITKIIVQNKEGTNTSEFNNSKLAKVEIASKTLSGSTVLVQYKIVITNEGELAGNAQQIVSYLPDGMTFNSELNTQWYLAVDGNIYNESLANTVIEPGQSKEITLILVKNMTTSNVGTTQNTVRIAKYANSREFADINEANNTSSSEVLISIKTGDIIMYATLIILSVMITIAGIYFIKKKLL